MKTIEEVKNWLLENRVNDFGNLILNDLDFSDFDGDVYLDDMKVKKNLYRNSCKIGGDLMSNWNKVGGDLYSKGNKFCGEVYITTPTKLLKKITIEELAKMGYELMEEEL